jgi:hypothetical protein
MIQMMHWGREAKYMFEEKSWKNESLLVVIANKISSYPMWTVGWGSIIKFFFFSFLVSRCENFSWTVTTKRPFFFGW